MISHDKLGIMLSETKNLFYFLLNNSLRIGLNFYSMILFVFIENTID